MKHKTGVFNRPWTELSMDRALEAMAATGSEYIGLMLQHGKYVLTADSTPDEIEQLKLGISQAGLQLVVILTQVDLRAPLNEARKRIRRMIAVTKQAGARYLLTTGSDDSELYERYYEVIADSMSCAQDSGIKVALKPHGGLSATAQDCLRAIERIDSPSFSIWYDPGNILHYTNSKPEQDVGTIAKHVTGVCIKDCDLSTKQRDVMITPGDGDVDFAQVLGILQRAGFCGPCLIETVGGTTPEEITTQGSRAVAFVRKVLSGNAA